MAPSGSTNPPKVRNPYVSRDVKNARGEGGDNDPENSTPKRRGGGSSRLNDNVRAVGGTINNDFEQEVQQEAGDEASVARAAAEVSVMDRAENVGVGIGIAVGGAGGGGRVRGGRSRPPGMDAANAAIQGTSGDGGESAFEVIDEGGELVRIRFHEFLREYSETISVFKAYDEETNEPIFEESTNLPYINQAQQIANRQRKMFHDAKPKLPPRKKKPDEDEDEEEEEELCRVTMSPFTGTVCVNFRHVLAFDPELAEALELEYIRFDPFLRRAAKEFMLSLHPELDASNMTYSSTDDFVQGKAVVAYFVAVYNAPSIFPVRSLRADLIGQLTSVTGTITRTSDVRPELLMACYRCRKCGLVAPDVAQEYHLTRPILCRNPRCQNRSGSEFILELNERTDRKAGGGKGKSQFVDWQRLRVQENADEIPAGSMPRTIDVVLRNEFVERAKAGDRVVLTGSLIVVPDGSALARSGETVKTAGSIGRAGREAASGGGGGVRGLKALGVRELTYRTCFLASCVLPTDLAVRVMRMDDEVVEEEGYLNQYWMFGNDFGRKSSSKNASEKMMKELSDEEKAEIVRMSNSPRLYEQLAESIAPTTFGHIQVKKGILLMLLGGVHKNTKEGIRLRGDINVCIVGDPSTAKSQFLKFVHSFLPERCVYTSGKAASAAGLTAAVVRDQDTGEYCIEAGALMLADNGICCIDEFDKMDQHDQVAIHEAMEQQTISITKAGIQATLNARASILAAANPIHGRYDRSKTLRANVQLSAPILSRFDLFFVVLDECDDQIDFQVANHILNIHRGIETEVEAPFTKDQMLRYIRFARTIKPRITKESKEVLKECYVTLRKGDMMGRGTAYRITVRQLESLVRLSEALARLRCDGEVKPAYVREAFSLLKTSILHVETEDVILDDFRDDFGAREIENAEPTMDNNRTTATPIAGNAVSIEDSNPTGEGHPQGREIKPKKNKKAKKLKEKIQISFEKYQSISYAIFTFLARKEAFDKTKFLTWGELVEWYLEQCESEIGGSLEELERLRKITNLVIRRLVHVDHNLMLLDDSESEDPSNFSQRKIALHPNFELTPGSGNY